jgi:hypothetical protein
MNINASEYKDIGDAVGNPDETDRKQIKAIIDTFEKKHPGEIKKHRDGASEHIKTLKTDVVGGKAARRYALEIPEPLYLSLEQYIPTLFRSKKHFNWLRKNFKELFLEIK